MLVSFGAEYRKLVFCGCDWLMRIGQKITLLSKLVGCIDMGIAVNQSYEKRCPCILNSHVFLVRKNNGSE